jgi:SAM-dependent methyltransferase
MTCRHCGSKLIIPFLDLGFAPPSNAYLTKEALCVPEKWFPLRVMVCNNCWLVQTEDFAHSEELFSDDYAYFSSFSSSWLRHAETYVNSIIERLNLTTSSFVVEIAANDGYLLQYIQAAGIPCMGVEPTASTAAAARAKGLIIVEEFFGEQLARKLDKEGKQADLVVANNVLAHVPDINDFVKGISMLLKTDGVVTFEFPHVLRLIEMNQFDTIYHEHFSYLSLTAIAKILTMNGLIMFDVEELSTHGGSLRVYAQRHNSQAYTISKSVDMLLSREYESGISSKSAYTGFQTKANKVKDDLLAFLIEAKRNNQKVIGYGAAAKGNTLLNYAGIKADMLPLVVDRNPAKQRNYLPGSHIPIFDESIIQKEKPDFILLLPWNLREELTEQLSFIREWGGQFIVAVPALMIFA